MHAGDALEIWTNRGHFVVEVSSLKFDKTGNVLVEVNRGVGKGDRVFRVRNAEAAFIDDDKEPRIPLYGKACLRIGEPLTLTVSTNSFEAEPWYND